MHKQKGALTAHLLASFVWKSKIIGHLLHFDGMAPSQPHLPARSKDASRQHNRPLLGRNRPRPAAERLQGHHHIQGICDAAGTRLILGALTRSQRSQGSASAVPRDTLVLVNFFWYIPLHDLKSKTRRRPSPQFIFIFCERLSQKINFCYLFPNK